MRGFIIFLLIAGLGILFLRQKHNETSATIKKPPVATTQAKPTAAPLTPAPRGQASEYNYMKRALDRARDVTEQARSRTQAAQSDQP
jgi:hypothetical protein